MIKTEGKNQNAENAQQSTEVRAPEIPGAFVKAWGYITQYFDAVMEVLVYILGTAMVVLGLFGVVRVSFFDIVVLAFIMLATHRMMHKH